MSWLWSHRVGSCKSFPKIKSIWDEELLSKFFLRSEENETNESDSSEEVLLRGPDDPAVANPGEIAQDGDAPLRRRRRSAVDLGNP